MAAGRGESLVLALTGIQAADFVELAAHWEREQQSYDNHVPSHHRAIPFGRLLPTRCRDASLFYARGGQKRGIEEYRGMTLLCTRAPAKRCCVTRACPLGCVGLASMRILVLVTGPHHKPPLPPISPHQVHLRSELYGRLRPRRHSGRGLLDHWMRCLE